MLGGCNSSGPGTTAIGLPGVNGDVPVSNAATLFPGPEQNLYEPTLGIDPTDPDTIVAFVTDLSITNASAGVTCCADRLYRSTDGGRSWVDGGYLDHPVEPDYILGADPTMTFDAQGIAYFADMFRPANEFRYIYVYRSEDGGARWSAPSIAFAPERSADGLHCTSIDKEWLTPGLQAGELMLVYTQTNFRCALGEEPTGLGVLLAVEDIGIYMKRSYDGGRSWTQGQKIWDGYALGAIAKAAPDGTLYTAFWGIVTTPDPLCPQLILGDVFEPQQGQFFSAILLGRSLDDGQSWSYQQFSQCSYADATLPGFLAKPGDFGGGNSLPSVAVDEATGAVHVAFPNLSLPENRFSITLTSTLDRGASWSEPVAVTSGPDDARQPSILADAGHLWIAYQTTRSDNTGDTWMIHSVDGGASWKAPQRLSSESAQYTGNPQVRDYIGFDRVGDRFSVMWTQAQANAPTVIRAWTGTPD